MPKLMITILLNLMADVNEVIRTDISYEVYCELRDGGGCTNVKFEQSLKRTWAISIREGQWFTIGFRDPKFAPDQRVMVNWD